MTSRTNQDGCKGFCDDNINAIVFKIVTLVRGDVKNDENFMDGPNRKYAALSQCFFRLKNIGNVLLLEDFQPLLKWFKSSGYITTPDHNPLVNEHGFSENKL